MADSLHLLAVIYDDKHDYAKAEPLNRRALALRENALGPDHPDVARSLFNLAWLSKVKEDLSQAESLYRRALAEDKERRLVCLDHCLHGLPAESRELIVEYYREEKRERIEARRALAERLGVKSEALTNRAQRVRDKLEHCVNTCLGNESAT